MRRVALHLPMFVVSFTAFVFAAEPEKRPADIAPVMCKRGKLLFEESFTEPAINKAWHTYKGNIVVENGALKSQEVAADAHHPAISRKLGAKNVIVQFSFRFDGGKWLGVSFDNKEHVARVMLGPDNFRVMKFSGIGATTKGEQLGQKKTKFEPGKWYTMLVEIHGNEMVARLDDQTYTFGEASAGVDQDKTRFELISGGDWVGFDDIRIWEAEPNPDWAATKAKLIALQPIDKKAKK